MLARVCLDEMYNLCLWIAQLFFLHGRPPSVPNRLKLPLEPTFYSVTADIAFCQWSSRQDGTIHVRLSVLRICAGRGEGVQWHHRGPAFSRRPRPVAGGANPWWRCRSRVCG